MTGRILIADSVATNRIILKVKLSTASYDVWQVEDAHALQNTARNERPDLIIMDADLPGCDGFRICRDLKNDPSTALIPIIIVAEHYNRDVRLQALRAGAEDILPKPHDEQVLLARVRNLLRVRSMEEELHRREGTAAEFGFHEASAGFQERAQIAIIYGANAKPCGWEKILASELNANVETYSDDHVLEQIGQLRKAPDVILLQPELRRKKSGLTLVAELRSRAETRHSAIIVGCYRLEKPAATAALDIGANDLIEADSLAEEVSVRVNNQLRRKRKSDQLRRTLEDGLRLAVTDPLTGLFNRRYAQPHTAKIAARAWETGMPFAVMVLDLDRFKKINDTHGHSAGDCVLREIANRLKNNLRSVDLLCRIGGEEFLVVMPDTNFEAATKAAERLRRVTEAEPVFVSADIGPVLVTVSIGVSIGGQEGQYAMPVDKIVDLADRALMGSKSSGRNQVSFRQSAA